MSRTESQFVETFAPLFESGQIDCVSEKLVDPWSLTQLIDLLYSHDDAVVRMAATCLGILGRPQAECQLVSLLGHPADAVAAAAEDALWQIWMRAGTVEGNSQLMLANARIREGQFELAAEQLRLLALSEPTFAEAQHQRAIALHSLDQLDAAYDCYSVAIRLNPRHFGAAAGLGHVCVQQGNLHDALRWYRRAVHIHPRLSEIREVIPQLAAVTARRVVA